MAARVIALTGAIGSGKSTVLKIAAQQPGVVVVSADALVHQILADPTHPVVQSIAQEFGADLVGPTGVDRRSLGQRVLGDDVARKKLEGWIHPAVRSLMLERISQAMDTAAAIVVEVPLLFETGMHQMFAESWAVVADASVRQSRVHDRDGLSAQEFATRNGLQVDDATRMRLATHLIHNQGDLDQLRRRVLELLALK